MRSAGGRTGSSARGGGSGGLSSGSSHGVNSRVRVEIEGEGFRMRNPPISCRTVPCITGSRSVKKSADIAEPCAGPRPVA